MHLHSELVKFLTLYTDICKHIHQVPPTVDLTSKMKLF